MKKIYFLGIFLACSFLVLAIILIFSQPATAPTAEISILGEQINRAQINNQKIYDLSQAEVSDPEIQATAYLLINLSNKNVISQNRLHDSLPIASLTKLMTAWTVLRHGDLNDVYTIQAKDVESISPSLNLQPGDQVVVKDLVKSILIGSANDGALALSHYIEQKYNQDSSEQVKFTDLMNKEAQSLRMFDSRFSNPTGFDNVANYSSVLDILLLTEQLEKTGILEETGQATNYSFTSPFGKTYSIRATNRLIGRYGDLYAIKTGFTNEAQGSMITKVKRPEAEYLIIVIGSPDREGDTLRLRAKVLRPSS